MTPSRTDAAAWAVVGSLVAGAAGFPPPRLFPGSWSQWSADRNNPIATHV